VETSIIEKTPHFMTDIQKTKVVGMLDKRQLRPVKRRGVQAQREREKLQIARHAERNELLKNLKTVIVAQDRYTSHDTTHCHYVVH
jgi:hypothetical protein